MPVPPAWSGCWARWWTTCRRRPFAFRTPRPSRPAGPQPVRHTTCSDWAQTMAGILAVSHEQGFLSNFAEASQEWDAAYSLMRRLCEEFGPEKPGRAAQWLERTGQELLADYLH